MTALTNTQFDYEELEPDDFKKIKRAESKLNSSRKRAAAEVICHGEVLADVQSALANYSGGAFVSWLESQGISNRSAYNFIDAYKAFGSFANLQNIEASAMYALAKNDKAKKKALKLADDGTKVTNQIAKQLIEASPPPKPKAPPKADPPPKAAPPKPAPPKQQPDVEPDSFEDYEDVDDDEPETEEEESADETRIKYQKVKTRKTAEALMRAVDDLHELVPDQRRQKPMIDWCMKILDELKGWK
jgi:hypothetical protein